MSQHTYPTVLSLLTALMVQTAHSSSVEQPNTTLDGGGGRSAGTDLQLLCSVAQGQAVGRSGGDGVVNYGGFVHTEDIPTFTVDLDKTVPHGNHVDAGEHVTYRVSVSNYSEVALSALTLTDVFRSADLDFVSASETPASETDASVTLSETPTVEPWHGWSATLRFDVLPFSGRAIRAVTNTVEAIGTGATGESTTERDTAVFNAQRPGSSFWFE